MLLLLQKFGLRESALGRPHQRLPNWLAKWAALILQFVELERSLLPAQLLALQLRARYTPLAAAAEAKGTARLMTRKMCFVEQIGMCWSLQNICDNSHCLDCVCWHRPFHAYALTALVSFPDRGQEILTRISHRHGEF